MDLVPGAGPLAAAVPGAMDAWLLLLRDHGTRELDEVARFAIGYAAAGHPVSERVCATIAAVQDLFTDDWTTSARLWLPDGRPPVPGTLVRNPAWAATLGRLVAAADAGGGTASSASTRPGGLGGGLRRRRGGRLRPAPVPRLQRRTAPRRADRRGPGGLPRPVGGPAGPLLARARDREDGPVGVGSGAAGDPGAARGGGARAGAGPGRTRGRTPGGRGAGAGAGRPGGLVRRRRGHPHADPAVAVLQRRPGGADHRRRLPGAAPRLPRRPRPTGRGARGGGLRRPPPPVGGPTDPLAATTGEPTVRGDGVTRGTPCTSTSSTPPAR